MTFFWPDMLWLLTAVPALVAVYLLLLRRKKKAALRYASLGLVKEAMGVGQRFRRHVPPLLLALALATMLIAVARPAAIVTLPMSQQTIILAMDVSGSMRARDVQPSRLAAAQEAAKAFVADLPRGVRVFTVGVGTPNGEVIGFEGWSFRTRLDEEALKSIADLTRGEYFHAGTALDLKKVYRGLNARLVFEKKPTEITALFSAAAAVLAFVSALLSLLWFNRIL